MACEYGPTEAGAFSVLMTSFPMMTNEQVILYSYDQRLLSPSSRRKHDC